MRDLGAGFDHAGIVATSRAGSSAVANGSSLLRAVVGMGSCHFRRMHMQTVIVKAPRSFVDGVLWPEFQELSGALTAYLAEIKDNL
jgi:hypothetical protein